MIGLTPQQREDVERVIKIRKEIERREGQREFYRLFPDEDSEERNPDTGIPKYPARHKYGKHLEFFRVGRVYRQRCFMAANRVGKTVAGSYEVSCHLTGLYPEWWEGRVFAQYTRIWAAGKTNETTRDILQKELLGDVIHSMPKRFTGTGVIPGETIGEVTWKQGVTDLADTVKIRHKSGRWSMLGLKSYQQGRGAFEGTAQHAVLFDEEPPIEVYDEAVIRTASTNGIILLTFTPLEGLSTTVKQFMPGDMRPDG